MTKMGRMGAPYTNIIVSGPRRSLTSGVTRALWLASEWPVLISMRAEHRIRQRQVDPTYDPNPNGYFVNDYDPEDLPSGTIAKVSLGQLPRLTRSALVLVLRRDPGEREESLWRGFNIREPDDFKSFEQRSLAFAHDLDHLTITEVDHADVINDAASVFAALADNGWPIDPVACAAAIDPALYRIAM